MTDLWAVFGVLAAVVVLVTAIEYARAFIRGIG